LVFTLDRQEKIYFFLGFGWGKFLKLGNFEKCKSKVPGFQSPLASLFNFKLKAIVGWIFRVGPIFPFP
jgi:hypothetical protein